MSQVKAVLFDLDNTLIDFWKMKEAASRADYEIDSITHALKIVRA